jgi:integrase
MPKLTKRVVDVIRPDPAGRDVFVWDDLIKGFGLRVKPSGTASWLVQYRTAEGRSRRLVLGRLGVLTPDQARAAAGERLREVAAGGDPSAERHHARREALTVADLAALYLKEGPADKPNKRASSWATDRSNIARHIVPLLGCHLIKALTHADVARFQSDVASGKSAVDERTGPRGRAIVEGGRGTAARSLAVLGAILEFAVSRGMVERNQAKGVKLLKGQPKERFLSEAEVARLADTLAVMQSEHRLTAIAANAVRLLLLTGCRKNEILALRWEEVDFERGCLRLAETKTGARMVPLAAAALALLAELPRAGAFVMPSAKGSGHYTGLQKDWERIRERAGLPGLRLHDLRHSFASFAVASGETLFLTGKVLGHRQSRTTEAYAHLSDDPLRAVADRTGARIAAAMRPAAEGECDGLSWSITAARFHCRCAARCHIGRSRRRWRRLHTRRAVGCTIGHFTRRQLQRQDPDSLAVCGTRDRRGWRARCCARLHGPARSRRRASRDASRFLNLAAA